tara:strand:- start:1416 stop:2231 length:816 start_codon:yes stop_codon:yes gene_type:complete
MLEDRAEYIESLLQRIYALLDELREERDSDDPWDPPYDGRSDVDVVTRSATNIEEDEATLRGEVDFNNEDEATVYFEYGKSSSNLKYDTTHLVLDEDDDDEDYQQIITDLDEDTKYYFRAVAEDENGDEDYGKILSFRTDENGSSSNNDDYPEVDVDSATNITDDSAKLRGEVDMNDFKNGLVFFVYGEDEDQVDDIADDYDTYSEVDEDGDDLQKIRIDYDLDTDATFYANVSGLNDDTDIYFNLCVEFEDEDDDDRIVCGDTEDFTTDD